MARRTVNGSVSLAAVAAAAALALAGCAEREEPRGPAPLGRTVIAGAVRAVSPSADGAWLAALSDCADATGQFLPKGTASCTLSVAPVTGGDAKVIARAVTTLPQGLLWSPAGAALAALAGYEVPTARGTLVLWRGGEPRVVAERVSWFAFGADGALGYVADGRFGLVGADGAPVPVPELTDVATFELPPAGAAARCRPGALVRRTARAGGALLELCGRAPEVVASGVTDYAAAPGGGALAYVTAARDTTALFLRDGKRSARVGAGAQQFSFSRDGAALAYVGGVAPGKQGDLHVWSGGKGARLAEAVGEYQWAASARRLVWLERYDTRVRAGRVGAGGPELAPRAFADQVSDAAISADGAHVAFLRHSARGGYTVELGLAHLDAPAPQAPPGPGAAPAPGAAQPQAAPAPPRFWLVASGVFGFAFSPDARWLYYRTRCVGEAADACDLERIPAAGLAAGAAPEVIAEGVSNFAFAPGAPERLLLVWRSGPSGGAVDVAVWDRGVVTSVDRRVAPGTARFLAPDARRLAYVVADGPGAGARVAELPGAPPPP